MSRLALIFIALLPACGPAVSPLPAPALQLRRVDAHHIQATLWPPPSRARWSLRLSAECGAGADALPALGGDWPQGRPLTVMAGLGDLLAVWGHSAAGQPFRVADCMPLDVAGDQP